MLLCKQMLEMLEHEEFILYASAGLKHSLDCFSFCYRQNAGNWFTAVG
jgi:hypothetical protein